MKKIVFLLSSATAPFSPSSRPTGFQADKVLSVHSSDTFPPLPTGAGEEPPAVPVAARPTPLPLPRWFAALQVFLVSGLPTGTLILIALVLTGRPMTSTGSMITSDPSQISLEFFAMLSLLDTAVVAVLIRIFLVMSRENSQDVFVGRRPVAAEFARGLLLIPVAWAIIAALIFSLNLAFPGLHNVAKNPYAQYMNTPLRAAVTIVVVILAGGVREELQRGFILHRFEQRLGGAYVGLAVFTLAFGLGHVSQGFDAAIAVGLLGAIWGLIYIRRRSVVAPMVSHAGFDASQVLLQLVTSTLAR